MPQPHDSIMYFDFLYFLLLSTLKSKVDRLNRELMSKDDQLKSAEMKIINSNEVHGEQVL